MAVVVTLCVTNPKDGTPQTMTFNQAVRVELLTTGPYIYLYNNTGQPVAGFSVSQIIGWEIK